MSVIRGLRREFAASDEVVFRSPGDIARKLREVGVRPTTQRVALMSILVRESGHTTAKRLHETAVKSRIAVSLATVYNTLHHLTKHRLLRPTSVDNSTVFFEINRSQHHHFFVEDRNELVDIPPSAMRLKRLPVPPQAFSVSGVEVLVKLRRKEIKIAATIEGRRNYNRSFVRFLLVGQNWLLPDLDRLLPQAVHPVSAKRHFRWTRTNPAIQERLRLDLNAWNREVPAQLSRMVVTTSY